MVLATESNSFSFEDAFALLIREIETIRRDALVKTNSLPSATPNNPLQTLYHQPSVGFAPVENSLPTLDSLDAKSKISRDIANQGASNWDVDGVKQWLARIQLSQ